MSGRESFHPIIHMDKIWGNHEPSDLVGKTFGYYNNYLIHLKDISDLWVVYI
jgi:hypothetical protein